MNGQARHIQFTMGIAALVIGHVVGVGGLTLWSITAWNLFASKWQVLVHLKWVHLRHCTSLVADASGKVNEGKPKLGMPRPIGAVVAGDGIGYNVRQSRPCLLSYDSIAGHIRLSSFFPRSNKPRSW
jgi:hypothetical protein